MPPLTQQAAVLSADISGFTAMFRQAESEEMHELLNGYFALIDGVVEQHGGEVIQHVGDCVVAIFQGDRVSAATQASQAAWTMHHAVSTVRSPEDDRRCFLRIHVGVAYGDVVVEGPANKRTLLGQAVEDAEELQGLAQSRQTAISSEVQNALGLACETLVGGVTAANDLWFVLSAIELSDIDIDMLAQAFSAAGGTLEGEKRQVTILFAALGGREGVSLSQATTTEWHGLAGNAVEQHGGSVDKHIGPCVMALFGAPIAYSNDHYRALETAFHLVDVVRNRLEQEGVNVRVGIASGQVVASETGSRAFIEYTVTGDSVNLASRLLSQALENEVIISDAVYRALKSQVTCENLGELTIKGFEATVSAWRAGAFVAPSHRAQATSFVGRTGVLDSFRAYLAGPSAHQGLTLYLRGEAGMGKSALADQLERLAESVSYQCHHGRALDFGEGLGPGPMGMVVRSLIRAPINVYDSVGAELAVEEAIEAGLVEPDDESHLRAILRLPQPTRLHALYDAMDNEAHVAGARRVVAAVVRRVSSQCRLLLRLEDLHWANDVVVGQFETISELTHELPIVVVATSRVDNCPLRNGRLADGTEYEIVELGPFSEGEAHDLASQYPHLSQRFMERCIQRAAGNPLFLQQLLDGGERAESEEIPGSVHSLALAKMDQLPRIHKSAIQAAAVLGEHFDLKTLNALLEHDQEDLDISISSRLIQVTDTGFMFSHALIRDSVYSSLLKRQRHRLHYLAACAYEGQDVVLKAKHLDRAEHGNAPAAYIDAANAQFAAYQSASSIQLLRRAQELSENKNTLCAATLRLGDMVRDQGQISEALAEYNAALDSEPDDESRCRARIGRAACMRVSDEITQALAELEIAQGLAEGIGEASLLAEIHYYRGNLFFPLGRIEECLSEHQASLAHARGVGSQRAEALALSGLGDAYYAKGRMVSANPYFQQCLALCREHGLGRIESANSFMVGTVRIYLNELDGALEDSLYSADLARKVGNQRAEIVSRLTAGWILIMQLRLDEAREQVERGLALVESLGAKRFDPFLRESLSRILLHEGREEEAIAEAERALVMVREGGMRFIGPWVLSAVALATQDAEVRQAALQEGLDLLGVGAVGHNYFNFYVQAMEASLNASDWDSAVVYANALKAYTSVEALPWSDFFIERTLALVEFERQGGSKEARRRVMAVDDHAARVRMEVARPLLKAALDTA